MSSIADIPLAEPVAVKPEMSSLLSLVREDIACVR